MVKILMVLSCTCIIASCFLLSDGDSPKSTKPAQEARVVDIGGAVILIGRLGKPLGSEIEVLGKWSLPKGIVKDYSPRFTVSRVDGKLLEKEVEFNVAVVKVFEKNLYTSALPSFEKRGTLDGKEWTLTAYETGRIGIVPQTGSFPDVTMPYYTEAFISEIVGVLK